MVDLCLSRFACCVHGGHTIGEHWRVPALARFVRVAIRLDADAMQAQGGQADVTCSDHLCVAVLERIIDQVSDCFSQCLLAPPNSRHINVKRHLSSNSECLLPAAARRGARRIVVLVNGVNMSASHGLRDS